MLKGEPEEENLALCKILVTMQINTYDNNFIQTKTLKTDWQKTT